MGCFQTQMGRDKLQLVFEWAKEGRGEREQWWETKWVTDRNKTLFADCFMPVTFHGEIWTMLRMSVEFPASCAYLLCMDSFITSNQTQSHTPANTNNNSWMWLFLFLMCCAKTHFICEGSYGFFEWGGNTKQILSKDGLFLTLFLLVPQCHEIPCDVKIKFD